MCATCGCGQPKNKHGEKTLAAANKKFAKKSSGKCTKCGKVGCVCKDKKAAPKKGKK